MKIGRITIVFLLLLMILAGMNGIIRFYVFKLEMRKEFKAILKGNLKPKDIVELRVSTNEKYKIQWINKHEFKYNGDLYDVIKSKKSSDFITYTLLSDAHEEALLEGVKDDFFQGKLSTSENSKTQRCIKFTLKEYLLPRPYLIQNSFVELKPNLFSFHFVDPSISFNNDSPPPENLIFS
jgi:hypothetical protein